MVARHIAVAGYTEARLEASKAEIVEANNRADAIEASALASATAAAAGDDSAAAAVRAIVLCFASVCQHGCGVQALTSRVRSTLQALAAKDQALAAKDKEIAALKQVCAPAAAAALDWMLSVRGRLS